MARLVDIGLTDLLARIAREGAVTLPLRDVGEFRVIPKPHKLEPSPAAASALGAPVAVPLHETTEPPPAAANSAGDQQ